MIGPEAKTEPSCPADEVSMTKPSLGATLRRDFFADPHVWRASLLFLSHDDLIDLIRVYGSYAGVINTAAAERLIPPTAAYRCY